MRAARFAALLDAVVRDPALLIWLDAPSNRREHPNENLARELMELFTLGIGHFTETDVKQAARALTGWTVKDKSFAEDLEAHDTGEKTILGQRGNWSGTDLVKMLLEHPATSLRLAWRICDTFLGEEAATAADIAVAGGRTARAQPRRRLGRRDGAALRGVLLPKRTSAGACSRRSSTSSARCARSSSTTRRPARSRWPRRSR